MWRSSAAAASLGQRLQVRGLAEAARMLAHLALHQQC